MNSNELQKREPKRVIVKNSKFQTDGTKHAHQEKEDQIFIQSGTQIAIDYIYNKMAKEDIADKYGISVNFVVSCVSEYGDKITKYLDDDIKKSIIENIQTYTPFEKKLGIIVDNYENNFQPKNLSQKYNIAESNVRGIIINFSQNLPSIQNVNNGKIKSFRRRDNFNDVLTKSDNSINLDDPIDFKKDKFVQILSEHKETGAPFVKLAEKYGILYQTLLNWKKKYGDIEIKKPKFITIPSKHMSKETILAIIKEKNESNLSFRGLTEKYNLDYHAFLLKKYWLKKESYPKKTDQESHEYASNFGKNIDANESNRIRELEAEIARLNKIIDNLILK